MQGDVDTRHRSMGRRVDRDWTVKGMSYAPKLCVRRGWALLSTMPASVIDGASIYWQFLVRPCYRSIVWNNMLLFIPLATTTKPHRETGAKSNIRRAIDHLFFVCLKGAPSSRSLFGIRSFLTAQLVHHTSVNRRTAVTLIFRSSSYFRMMRIAS